MNFQVRCLCVLSILTIGLLAPGSKSTLGQETTVAKQAVDQPSVANVQFDRELLHRVPAEFPADGFSADGVRALFFEGPAYKGKSTRVFAWYGIPDEPEASVADRKYPAMVLIHGGGGTAFDRWVRLWNSRGYAAIAMDVCGCVPTGTYGNWQRHDHGGPPGWNASFDQLDDPISDQWTWHAVSAAAMAHSLICSYPEVDPERTGVTGISWGGYLTCIVAGVDDRFKLAAPVYGCGFLGENSAWLPDFARMGPERSSIWLGQWDPSVYLPQAHMPMLWVNGTNDFAYPMDSWRKSYQLSPGDQTLCLRVRMPHGHGAAGENPNEILAFANSILKQQTPLARVVDHGQNDEQLWATYKSEAPITRAELCFTNASGKWQDREWQTAPADIDSQQSRVTAQIPPGATVYYLNLFDDKDCAVSTPHIERSEDI